MSKKPESILSARALVGMRSLSQAERRRLVIAWGDLWPSNPDNLRVTLHELNDMANRLSPLPKNKGGTQLFIYRATQKYSFVVRFDGPTSVVEDILNNELADMLLNRRGGGQ